MERNSFYRYLRHFEVENMKCYFSTGFILIFEWPQLEETELRSDRINKQTAGSRQIDYCSPKTFSVVYIYDG